MQDLNSHLHGEECPEETNINLQTAIKNAFDNGLPLEYVNKLHKLLSKYRDIFRSRIGSDPPALIPPMKTELIPGIKPYKTKQR